MSECRGLYASAKKFVGWPITPGFEFSGVVESYVLTSGAHIALAARSALVCVDTPPSALVLL